MGQVDNFEFSYFDICFSEIQLFHANYSGVFRNQIQFQNRKYEWIWYASLGNTEIETRDVVKILIKSAQTFLIKAIVKVKTIGFFYDKFFIKENIDEFKSFRRWIVLNIFVVVSWPRCESLATK